LRHPKEILSGSDKNASPYVQIKDDCPTSATEFELEKEEQFPYQLNQALKNI
jgi:hypothetical protein